MKKRLLLLGMGIIAMILVGCGQTIKQSSDLESSTGELGQNTEMTKRTYAVVNQNETIIARTKMNMKLSSQANGMSILSVENIEDSESVIIGDIPVPEFVTFYVTGNITFNVTEQTWTEADGFIMYVLDYNDLTSSDIEKIYVRAYMLENDGLTGKTVTSSIIDLQAKAFGAFNYTDLTKTPLIINEWEPPYSEAIEHMQPMKFRADFTSALQQSYGGTIIFELIRQEKDTTPPGVPTNFTATAGDSVVTLNWTNPTDEDFLSVDLRRSETSYPTTINEGISIYSNNGTLYIDNNVTNNTAYYYSIFARDEAGNWSSYATANATPTSPLDSYTKLMLHMDGMGGSFVDSSNSAYTVTSAGDATQTSTKSKWGNSSYFDGSGDYLSIPDSDDWNIGNDFTIDTWVYLTSTASYSSVCSQYVDMGNRWSIMIAPQDGDLWFFGSFGGVTSFWITGASNFNANTWYHIAVVRQNNTFYMFVNGTKLTTTETYNIPENCVNLNSDFRIGRHGSSNFGTGYIDEFRFSSGIARWTSSFTPPTAPY